MALGNAHCKRSLGGLLAPSLFVLMPLMLVAAEGVFVLVYTPSGEEIILNVAEISSIRQPTEGDRKQFHQDVHCVVVMGNARTIGIKETCRELLYRIVDKQPE